MQESKHVPPAISRKSFSCPHCGAHAHQTWFSAYAEAIKDSEYHEATPALWSPAQVQNARKIYQDLSEKDFINLEQWASGNVFLEKTENSKFVGHQLANLTASKCYSCNEISLWRYDKLLYPAIRYEIEPNHDMNQDIQNDFDEARAIVDISPRGAAELLRLCTQNLCKQLGKSGENINSDIASLVKDGLDSKIQQALDVVRVIGNAAVHPGELDIRDNREIAVKLFELVNLIAYETITRPNEVEKLFSDLPNEKREAIARRDLSSN